MEFEAEVINILKTYDQNNSYQYLESKEANAILNDKITLDEITSAVSKLKKGKSPGLDRIPVEFIKATINTIKHDMELIFNYILLKESYPLSWATGLRVAIPKGNSDIHPITIEPIFAKILETILDNRLGFINEAFKKVDIYNGGFLKGSMTQDNLLIVYTCIQKQLSLGKNLYVAFIDFKKALNYVNHNFLSFINY